MTQLRNIKNFANSDAYRSVIHSLIPGGAHTYSKGDDQFPQLSPAAIIKGKGAQIWDIDGNQFLDCSMGLTSVGLGHAYEPVINAVKSQLDNGVNFQRPSFLEKEMAEKFLSIIPQHDMVKFAKNGSIVTTAAVKLARAFTGRKMVAFPVDHPFYSYDDWFIGKTDCNKGVPPEIAALSVTFKSCDIDALEELFKQYSDQIACVIMEPERSVPNNEAAFGPGAAAYLEAAIALTHKHGALFIMDEMISGYKTAFPGSLTRYNLKPDMATWGKGVSNGFSFCALTGIRKVMELGGIKSKGEEKVFLISTTHGGETHTISAAIACLEEYSNKDVIGHNQIIGNSLIEKLTDVIDIAGLSEYISITPCNWMLTFTFLDADKKASMPLRTLVMQEMIRRGVLFQGAFVPCYSHTMEDVAYFVTAFSEMLTVYQAGLKEEYGKYLVGDVVKPVFRKYL